MDAERARAYLLTLPHVVETKQWGENLVFWVGDKALGGKMFALLNLDEDAQGYYELLELDGLKPAPYMARIHWVAAERWSAHRNAAWEAELSAAHALTLAKLPKRTRDVLALPAREQAKRLTERKKVLAAKTAAAKRK
jgi:predicted DNA-binding protein (MmcQ/YjbR family)